MEFVSGITMILFAILGLWLAFWLYISLPAGMARERNRDPVAWVIISLVCSPLFAIFFLWALGDAK